MKIVFVSNYYNHHQAPLCQALARRTEGQFAFVATSEMRDERRKMGYELKNVPDFVRYAHKTREERDDCLRLIREADVVIAGSAPEELIGPRIRAGKLTFRYSERFFRNRVSALEYAKKWLAQNLKNPRRKPVYLLCAGAYTAADYARIGLFSHRAYRWGYFPETSVGSAAGKRPNSILWAGRLMELKHPEHALEIARQLKREGYEYTMEIVGGGELEPRLNKMVCEYGIEDRVKLAGVLDPAAVRARMDASEIFLFTSDKQEGWGAVVNEAMGSGCAVVTSHAVGSAAFLVKNGVNGMIYPSGDVDKLYEKVKMLLDEPEQRSEMGRAARETIEKLWNADVAACRLMELSERILSGEESPDLWENGPCSKAQIITDDWMVQ